ncbi:MAG: substrate-binding domain-containing protein [Planktomarina sp.]
MKLALTIILAFFAVTARADSMRLAVTTSFHNSGLADVILPAIRRDTGVEIQLLVVGTGQALKLGQSGDVDAILVHAKPAEIAWIDAGHGPYRREVMYNDFVIVGPKADPAGLANAPTIGTALAQIGVTQSLFVSRGDDSGTHKAERGLWDRFSLTTGRPWYREAGSGMGATLNTAVGLGAYVMTDRASWLNFGNKADFEILFSDDPLLFNQYAYLPVSRVRHPHVNSHAVQVVENWLIGPIGQAAIGDYRLNGQQLFFPNAN